MNSFLELVIIVVIAVVVFTITYKLLPYRAWSNRKPKIALFPKYVASFYKPISDIEAALEKIQFKKVSEVKYSRGKIYGDFSAKVIKLSVDVDEENNQIKVYASFFGVLFDTGDVWQVTSDVLNG